LAPYQPAKRCGLAQPPLHSPARASGISLTVALLFLFAISVLGIAAIMSTTAEERMARYDRDHTIALAAAEVALRDAELDIKLSLSSTPYTAAGVSRSAAANTAAVSHFSCDCGISLTATQRGMCLPVSAISCTGASNPWTVASNWSGNGSVPLHAYTSATGTTGVPLTATTSLGSSQAPRYMIEILPNTDGPACSAKLNSGCVSYRYRITARGWGPNSGSATVQETFQP